MACGVKASCDCSGPLSGRLRALLQERPARLYLGERVSRRALKSPPAVPRSTARPLIANDTGRLPRSELAYQKLRETAGGAKVRPNQLCACSKYEAAAAESC